MIWYTACPSMLAHIRFVIMCMERLTGGFFSRASVGGSEARASDARASISRLIHSNWMAARGLCWYVKAPTRAVTTAAMLTVS